MAAKEEEVKLPATHKVAPGENLWKIAEHYYGSGYNWVDVAKENKLGNPNFLAVDQELAIPDVPVRYPEGGEIASGKKVPILTNIRWKEVTAFGRLPRRFMATAING